MKTTDRELFSRVLTLLLVAHSFISVQSAGDENGFLSFSVAALTVVEDSKGTYTSVSLPFKREGGTEGTVAATFKVINSSATDDFLSVSNTAVFNDGDVSTTGTLVLINDAIPEANETFLVEIVDARYGAELGSQTTLLLTVEASDEPYGRISFDESSLSLSGAEPVAGQSSEVHFQVNRGPGAFGKVTVDYKVTAGPSLGLLDLNSTEGQLVFADQDNTSTLSLTILSDNIPENSESFTITLSSPGGGALLADTNTQAELTVSSNDVPVRFGSTSTTVSEDAGSLVLTVYRGSLVGGDVIGPTDQETTVQYNVTSGTATEGTDFTSSAGTVTFQAGSTSETISIPISNDDEPEGDETFTVMLSNTSSDAVLQKPSSITVIISINDNAGGVVRFQSTENQTISEDSQTTATYTIERVESTLGDLTIGWSILDSNNQLAVSDFSSANGTVSLAAGESEVDLVVKAFDDSLPEEAEMFTVIVDQVVNGEAKLDNQSLRVAMLYVADSDDVYGVVQTVSGSGSIAVELLDRTLSFGLTRTGGTTGDILIQYRIIYLPPGISDPSEGTSGDVAPGTGSIQMLSGQSSANVTVSIFEDGFLDEGSRLYAEITTVQLIGATPLILPTSSPRIGSVSSLSTTVPFVAASGYISFSSNSISREVSEPDSGFETVTLSVFRGGSYGTATVTWTASAAPNSTFTSDDVLSSASTFMINHGSSSATFSIYISSDNDPELDEKFTVQLLTVTELNQNLAASQTTATVTIIRNDNPEGTFVIADVTKGPFFISEDEPLTIAVQRNGGDLTDEHIQYSVTPNGESEFFGSVGVLIFLVGETLSTVVLTPVKDLIPEVNETFTLLLSATNSDLIGDDSSVSITILANDDWNGVFSFYSSSLNQFIDEPANPGTNDDTLVTMANFTILRGAGQFGEAVVYWSVEGNTSDVTPTSGSVSFTEGQGSGWFHVSAVNDQITELNIAHTVELTQVFGGGRVADTNNTASLTVIRNDDPISFSVSDTFRLGEEGSHVIMQVIRGGDAGGVATASFNATYQTASSSDVKIYPTNGVVMFQDGIISESINISIVDDLTPELNENLFLTLVSTTGDSVIASSNYEAQLTILSSDDPNGVFYFSSNSSTAAVSEGSTVTLIVERGAGSFGSSLVTWQLYLVNSVTESLTPAITGDDFDVSSGTLQFMDGETRHSIVLRALDDLTPELEEDFSVKLLNITNGRLGSNTSSELALAESDDPFGIFGFGGISLEETWVAEDVPMNDEDNVTAVFNITRGAGTFGAVSVVWEVHPNSPSSPELPGFIDLFLQGLLGSEVMLLSQSRPSSETFAYNFTGKEDSIVTVPSHLQPDFIDGGEFALSLWVFLDEGSNGMILAKGTKDGTTIHYGLGVVADSNNMIIRFYYLPQLEDSGFSTIEVSVSESVLTLGDWHSLIISVSGVKVTFYVDGVFIVERTLSGSVNEGEGLLTVGGLSQSEFFEGFLQDVRIYSSALTEVQVTEIALEPAANDVTPVTGTVTFEEGDTEGSFTISSSEDDLTEFSEHFVVQLVFVSNNAKTDPAANESDLIVLKSDFSNGVFGYLLTDSVTSIEGSVIHLTVTRDKGMHSNVRLSWEVTQEGKLASEDFEYSFGEILFKANETEKDFVLEVSDEMVPELAETYTVTLVSATSEDIYPSTTPTSGASLNSSLTQRNITVSENDYPYGIVQFADSAPGEGTVPPASEVLQIDVSESSGEVVVYVVRAQGTVGGGEVEYTTSDGTATDGGVSPDYLATGGTLVFEEGEKVKNFTVQLVDNQIPELSKYFFVNLSIPNKDSDLTLGVGKDVVINILPSDDAFGLFSFTENSLSKVVDEQSGGTPVFLTITRGSKGSFGNVSIYWEAEESAEDITPSSGWVDFSQGQLAADLNIMVNNDVAPELHEVFKIVLVNATGGGNINTVGGVNIATLTISASDYPYGLFSFSSAFRPLSVSETGDPKTVSILREFGTTGNVRVEYMTMMATGLGSNNIATENLDYVGITDGSVLFAQNQTSQSFQITVVEDAVPELGEYFYIILTNATLIDKPVDNLGADGLPAILTTNNSNNATILIEENDDARGTVALSNSSFTATEGNTNFITLTRSGGTLGDIQVSWEVTVVSALPADLSAVEGTDTILEGEVTGSLSLGIVDDTLPESVETFTVRLTSVTKGAELGSLLTATVSIDASDDLNGRFGFSDSSQEVSVQEPSSGLKTFSLSIVRGGGSVGISEIKWNVSANNGQDPSLDIQPSGGSLFFSSGIIIKTISLSVLADSVPELQEKFTVSILSASGGARVDPDSSTSVVSVPANDKPFGAVSISSQTINATEEEAESTSSIVLQRIGNTLGTLEVTYDIRRSYPSSLDRFSLPISGLSPLSTYKSFEKNQFETDDVANECAISCAVVYTICKSFVVDTTAPLCEVYTETIEGTGNISRTGVEYYQAINGKLEPLANQLATPEEDFRLVSNGNVSMADGASTAIVMATILPDSTPELQENFTVVITNVQAHNSEDVLMEDLPSFEATPSIVSIAENDHPYGMFTLHSGQLQEVMVKEGASAIFTIERGGGRFGEVSIEWNTSVISPGLSASEFTGEGDIVSFGPGDSRATFTINVVDDEMPEGEESFRVLLSNPAGGAELGDYNQTVVTMTIEANDGAAGRVGFAVGSRAASIVEGTNVTLVLERSVGQSGVIKVYWDINDTNAENEFGRTSGSVIMSEGVSQISFNIPVKEDSNPELAESFSVELTSVEAVSLNVGEPSLDPGASISKLTVEANDKPYGEVNLSPDSFTVEVSEGTPTNITVIRDFGSFGAIQVVYAAMSSSSLGPESMLAEAPQDFSDDVMSVVMGDGVKAVEIEIPLNDDNDPELVEFFSIEIISAFLVSDPSVSVPVGSANTSEIIIGQSDNPNGLIELQDVQSPVSEDSGVINLFVDRKQGLTGDVSVSYQISHVDTDDADFDSLIQSGTIQFQDGVSLQVVQLLLVDDSVPELAEEFCFELFEPLAGASLGDANSTCITIAASDDPNGVFSFTIDSLHKLVKEAEENVNNDNIVTLTVQRSKGVFGSVTVPYNIDASASSDLSHSPGTLVFTEGEREKVITLTALADSNPELNETYSITLEEPSKGRLGDADTVAMVTILANQDPYGVLELYTSDGLTSLSVEEDVGSITFEVRRTFPSFGEITLDFATIAESAKVLDGSGNLDLMDSDYLEIVTTLTMVANQTTAEVTVEIYDDGIPETDETFLVNISNPVGGATLGEQRSILVTILSNDDAHGRIGFKEDFLSVVASEVDEVNDSVTLELERVGGAIGEVTAQWEVTGDHSDGELTPKSGEVTFADGVSSAFLTFTIKHDELPELNEVTTVTLTKITENGVPEGGDEDRGATLISGRSSSVITVSANDDPHGVFVWSFNHIEVEEEELDSTVLLYILREFGTIGAVAINYSTSVTGLSDAVATDGLDYVGVTNQIVFDAGQTSSMINITILADDIPEITESFNINIMNVALVNESDREGSQSNSPRVPAGKGNATVDILKNDDANGVLSFSGPKTIYVDENVGVVCLPLQRLGGTFGSVATDYTVEGVSAEGGGVDYKPDADNVQIEPGVNSTCIDITIINDLDPETEESLSVTLSNPSGGATLGSNTSVSIFIRKNDDINGIFTLSTDSLVLFIPEGSNGATLTVNRAKGTVGVVTVYWSVGEDGAADLTPTSGSVTFQDGETSKSFTIQAVDDGLPELYESYSLSLTSASGDGRITSPSSSSIAIPASDEPSGVVGFVPYPLNTIIVEEGDSFTASVNRSAGLFGSITIQWAISPADATTFATTGATEVFQDGQSSLTFSVSTLQDSKAEVARQFELTLVGAGDASINSSAATLTIIVAASDSPHGVVSFSSVSYSVSEDVGTASVTVQRTGGLVGDILVNFTAEDREAFSPSDYTLSDTSLVISENSNTGTISVTINDDTTPEIDEFFVLIIESVELSSDINGGRNFDFAGDESLIDSQPSLGGVTTANIDIEENDDARGVFDFSSSSVSVSEGSTATVEITRSKGTFGTVSVHYRVTGSSAEEDSDFSKASPASPIIFSVGQSSRSISIPIVDDTEPELQESFVVELTSSSSGSLGSLTQTNVFIEHSDNYYGRITFSNDDLANVIANPDTVPSPVTLTVERLDGTNDQIFVTWKVTGAEPGKEINDISPVQGVLPIADGQTSGEISLTVLISTGSEPEENFTVTITDVTEGVVLEEEGKQALITVLQRGQPFGVVGFYGEALGVRVTDETLNLSFPIIRNEGTFGTPEVFFSVSGKSPSTDVSPVTGSITFQEGQSASTITLEILADQTPELDEQFTVVLTGATGGAVIDSDASSSTFIIEANESPYGTFGISNTSLELYPDGETILRSLSFVIDRALGTDETVQVEVRIMYELEPEAGYFPENITKVFLPGQSNSLVTVYSTAEAYLATNARISISVVSVKLLSNSDESDVLPEISPFSGSVLFVIEEGVANAAVGFSNASLQATVIDGATTDNVILTVERSGVVGDVQISWSVGMYLEGVANGSLTPIVGSVMIASNDSSISLTFTATPTDPPSSPESFAVNLFVQSLSPLSARVANGRGVAIIEPRGVVKLTYSSFSEIEGATVFMAVSRIYGSLGAITVSGITMTATSDDLEPHQLAADPITDYPLGKMSVTLEDGQTSGNIPLILPYNTGTSPLKIFTFVLTSVTYLPGQEGVSTTPRLAIPNEKVPVTVIDSEGGSGVFEFMNSSAVITEDGSPLVQTFIRRTQGFQGTVSVEVTIEESRADGSTPVNQIASSADYTASSLFSPVTFANGEELKPVSIKILDDNVAEVTEYFTLQLLNPQGGKALINSDKSTFEIAISGNDNQGGLFQLTTLSLLLSEDDNPQGALTITRELGLFETVEINWRASYTDGRTHSVALGDLLVEDSGVVTFIPGQSTANITLTLQTDKVPLTSETFTITIYSSTSGVSFGATTATVTALPSGFSVFQFRKTSRKVVTAPFSVSLAVERTKGLTLDTSILYSTEEPSEPVTVGQVTFEPAQAGSHFTLVSGASVIFTPNKVNESIHLSIISTDTIPRAFYVNLEAVDDDSVTSGQAIVLICPSGVLCDLYSNYFDALDASASSLYSIAVSVKEKLEDRTVPGDNKTLSDVLLYTLTEITSTIDQEGASYSDSLKTVMSTIYGLIVSDSTYSGRSDFASAITAYGNSLLSGLSCSNASIVVSQSTYDIRSSRISPALLHTLELRTSDQDAVSLPETTLDFSTDCINVVFVAYSSSNLFRGPLFGNKVLTVSLQQPDVTKLNVPLKYRVQSPDGNVYPTSNSCLIWVGPSGSNDEGYWDSSLCKLSRSSVLEMEFIECECKSLGDYAVALPPNYGWTIPGPISCAFVVLVMIAITVLHVYYFRRIQLGTRILIMLCSTIAIFELVALVDMVVSTDISSSGCVAMGILLQLSVVAVFVWMLVLIISLWLNLMGFTSGQEPLVIYIFISWGLSAAIVIATILLGIYSLSWTLDQVYGRVGELCFIPSAGVAGVSTALPVLFSLLFAIGMLSHSCFYWTRWEDIKSLYKDTFNKRDVPLLLVFYTLLIFDFIFGALHLYLQQIYLFFVFFGFNVLLGLYGLVVYVFMSWHTLTWKHKHYPIKEEVEPLSLPEEPEFTPIAGDSFPDMYGSQQSLIPRYQPHPLPTQHGTIKSTTSSVGASSRPARHHQQHQREFIKLRQIQEPTDTVDSQSQHPPLVRVLLQSETTGRSGDSESELGNYDITQASDDETGSQMDDILYTLRTGAAVSSQGDDEDGDDDMQPFIQEMAVMRQKKSGSNEQFRMRRISIADTHL